MVGKLVLLAVVFIAAESAQSEKDSDRWWKSANIYQISPVSFKDSDNDGYGDIQGIISKLDHLVDTGVDVIFLSPFYKTSFKDFAYDISNYIEIDPRFGSLNDVEQLFQEAKQKGLKIIIDFVPNHSSNEHDWFLKSENRERGYENFYVWHDGKPTINEGRPLPPNDWQSVYGGSSWEWSAKREQYYYHAFGRVQPDLNLREQRVIDELDKTLEFWLEMGADGFRIDAVSQLFEDAAFVEDPVTVNNLPQTYELVEKWRALVDAFTASKGGDNKVLVPQVWDSKLDALMKYYEGQNETKRAQIPTNFLLINELNRNSKAADFKQAIDSYLKALPKVAVANWFLGTHDHSRVASRMEKERIDGLMLLLLTLPGVAFTYNGDEIGMLDHRGISWEETTDPWACNANSDDYKELSRDPSRTPFQWDGTTNSGFNAGARPWIPVHPDYVNNNLEAQKNDAKSHFNFYKNLLKLRKNETFVDGDFESKALTENVLTFSRSSTEETFVILINLGGRNETINVNDLTVNLKDTLDVVLASSLSSFETGNNLASKEILLAPFDAVILKARSGATTTTLSLLSIVMLIVKLFL